MAKLRGKIGKYSKITLQKKYQLLKMTEFGKNNLKDTSKYLQINYSTAKTICFQYQNNKIGHRLKFFKENSPIDKQEKNLSSNSQTATYKSRVFSQPKLKQITVICSSKNLKSSQNHFQGNSQSVGISTFSGKGQKIYVETQKVKDFNYIEKNKVIQHQFEKEILIQPEKYQRNTVQKNEKELEWHVLSLNGEEIKSQKIEEAQNMINMNQMMRYFPIVQYPYCFFIN